MKKLFYSIVVGTTIFCSYPVFAGGWATYNLTAKITTINIENGWVRAYFDADDKGDPNECGKTGVVAFIDDSKTRDRQYAALLTAYSTGQPVQLWVNGCLDGWGVRWPQLWAINLKK